MAQRTGVGFHWQVVAVTALPWLAVLLTSPVSADGDLPLLWLALGLPHVASTAGLYADRELRPMLQGPRYWQAPVALIVGAGLVAWAGGLEALIVVNAAWTLHHFAKQNLGMVAFTSRAARTPGPSALDRKIVLATGVAAMLGYTRSLFPALGWQVDTDLLVIAGVLILAGCAVLAWRSPCRWLMLAAVAFFAPLMLHVDPAVAAVAYTSAHGAQYLLMVGKCAAPSRSTMVAVAASTIVGGWLLVAWNHGTEWQAGAVLGVTFAHFVIDAGVWKMTTPGKRSYMAERFTFLA